MCGSSTTTKATPPPAANNAPVPRTEPEGGIKSEAITMGGATQLTGTTASSNPKKNFMRY